MAEGPQKLKQILIKERQLKDLAVAALVTDFQAAMVALEIQFIEVVAVVVPEVKVALETSLTICKDQTITADMVTDQ